MSQETGRQAKNAHKEGGNVHREAPTNRGNQDNEYPPNKQLAVGIQQRKDTSTPDMQERSGQPEELIFNEGTMNP